MTAQALEKHIYDTVKEWQMKIGYRKESMKLYYPAASLISLLGLENGTGTENLEDALEEFCHKMESVLGKICVSSDEKKERYCLDIPVQGVTYIAENIPDSVFLKKFLQVITAHGSTLEDVKTCFEQFAQEHGILCCQNDKTKEGMGHIFYFEYDGGPEGAGYGSEEKDEYVYCVEADDFGLTYHRFDKTDYKKML